MTAYDESAAENIGQADAHALFTRAYKLLAEGISLDDQSPFIAFGASAGDTFGGTDGYVQNIMINVAEGLGMTDVTLAEAVAVIAETIGNLATPTGSLRAAQFVNEQFSESDRITVAFGKLIAEGLGSSEGVTDLNNLVAVVTEALTLSGVATSNAHANHLVAEALAMADLLGRGMGAEINDTIGQTDLAASLVHFYSLVAEIAGLADAIDEPVRYAYVVADEDVGQTDWVTPNQRLRDLIADGIGLGGWMLSVDSTGTAWVLNTNSQGISEYDNYAFNSFAKQGQRFLAASDSGIYELAGADDSGTSIAAKIRTGLSQFGISRKKRISDLYIGYKSDGTLILKAIYNMDNEQREAWYELTDTSNAYDNARFKVGKGAKAVYWAFELLNIDGADFDLDKVEMHRVDLDRRL